MLSGICLVVVMMFSQIGSVTGLFPLTSFNNVQTKCSSSLFSLWQLCLVAATLKTSLSLPLRGLSGPKENGPDLVTVSRFTIAASYRTSAPQTPLPCPHPQPPCRRLGCPCGPLGERRERLPPWRPRLLPGPPPQSSPSSG